MNIGAMPAGVELDALIAEKVMGLHVELVEGVPRWVGKDLPGTPYVLKDGRFAHSIQRYSTDITAAWEVVEKVGLLRDCRSLREGGLGVQKGANWTRTGWEWVVEQVFQPLDENEIIARGETAPLAICRAALKICM